MPDFRPESDDAPQTPAASVTPDARQRPLYNRRMPALKIGQRLSSPLARCFFIGFLTFLLLIPLGLVRDKVYERSTLYREAAYDIASSWGQAQTVSGPVLMIPYQVWQDRKETITVKVDGKDENREVIKRYYYARTMVVLPSDLAFDATLETEERYRGIYRQTLYTAPMDISGSFTIPAVEDFGDNMSRILWDQAWLSVGISDLKTIAEATPVTWNGKQLGTYKPGSDTGTLLGPGFHAPIPLAESSAGASRSFALHLAIRGSEGLAFTPVGENTSITIKSAWPSPSFQGNLLPVERAITPEGFTARWAISNLTRTYPQLGDLENQAYESSYGGSSSAITAFTAGVNLHEPVTLYRMVGRSVDYGILFIAVTFVALFAFELISRQRMHMVQYGMVGLSMSVFYLVLLSLSEHLAFGLSFVAAGAVTIVMNGVYMAAVLRSRRRGVLMGALLAVLYLVLYSLLRMEDFSLLMGTGLVLVMMGALMFATRNLPLRAAPGSSSPAGADTQI